MPKEFIWEDATPEKVATVNMANSTASPQIRKQFHNTEVDILNTRNVDKELFLKCVEIAASIGFRPEGAAMRKITKDLYNEAIVIMKEIDNEAPPFH